MARGERVAGGTIQRMTVGQWVIDTEDGWYCLWQMDADWENRDGSTFDREKPWGIQTEDDLDRQDPWPRSWFESRREALASIGIDEFAPVVP